MFLLFVTHVHRFLAFVEFSMGMEIHTYRIIQNTCTCHTCVLNLPLPHHTVVQLPPAFITQWINQT